jgi:hypothetical protein
MSYAIKISIYIMSAKLCLAGFYAVPGQAAVVKKKAPLDEPLDGRQSLVPPQSSAQKAQKAQQSFSQCTARATAAVKARKLRLEELPIEIGRCTDRFPAAGLFHECKKNLFKSAKGAEIEPEDVARCKELLSAASFDSSKPAPIFVGSGQVVFAGVGLNRSVSTTGMVVPNYNCNQLQSVLANVPKNGQHLLFGNHPKLFASGKDQPAFLQKLTGLSPKIAKDNRYLDLPGFGRLYGDARTKQAVVYFPAGSCEFESNAGGIFAGLNLFYLVDEKSQMATPYFGIAYYRPGQKTVNTPELVNEVIAKLGLDYKPYSKDAQSIFIAATPFKEVDKERDPRNICELPRPHKLVAVIRTLAGKPNVPEYLLLANIRNLCEYGDRRAANLLR